MEELFTQDHIHTQEWLAQENSLFLNKPNITISIYYGTLFIMDTLS